MDMGFYRIFVPEEVFLRVTDLFEYPVVFFDMPVFGMDFFEIHSRDPFKRFLVSLVFRAAVVIRVEKGILFEDPDESDVTEMKDSSFFPERILRNLFVPFRFIARKPVGLQSEEETYSPFDEEFHVVLRSEPTVSRCHSWFESPVQHLLCHL